MACQKYHLKLENSSFRFNHFKVTRKIRQAADIEISTIYPTPRLENLCIFWSHVCVEQPDKVEPMTTLVLYSDIEPYMGRHSRMTMIRRQGEGMPLLLNSANKSVAIKITLSFFRVNRSKFLNNDFPGSTSMIDRQSIVVLEVMTLFMLEKQ